MKARRHLIVITICVLLFIAAVAAVVLLRKRAAPEPARLLPESDAVLYVDFSSIRTLTGLDQQFPRLAPGYDQFVKNTGFAFERDLDEAALAVHRAPPNASSPAAPQSAPHGPGSGLTRGLARNTTRYTEILVGRYDQARLAQYLRPHSSSVETYRDIDVYSVPIENRTLRIALLAIDTVAISNVDDPSVVHGIIDRFKKVALPFGGPSLVRDYYPRVPLGSLLWAVAHIPASTAWPNSGGSFSLPGGIDVGLPARSDVVVSCRMLASLHARADFYTPSEEAAKQFTEQTASFLAIFRGIQQSTTKGPGDADVKAVFDSIQIAQKGDRAEITATITPGFLRKLVREPASDEQEQTAPGLPATNTPAGPAPK